MLYYIIFVIFFFETNNKVVYTKLEYWNLYIKIIKVLNTVAP